MISPNTSLAIRTDIVFSKDVQSLFAAAGPRGDKFIARALNRTGGPVSTATRRQTIKVLGLRNHPYAKGPLGNAVARRMKTRKASANNLEFSLTGFGKGLPLIYYQPREGRAGATVNWLGRRKMVPRSFYLSGKFPRRQRSAISAWVSQRQKPGRWKLYRPKGPGVPEAMTTSAVASTWQAQAKARLPANIATALIAMMKGY